MTEPQVSSGVRPRLFLLPGRDKRLRAGKPWVYSNEIRMDAEAKAVPPGSQVSLHRVDGKPLGAAIFNPHALIAARLFSADADQQLDRDFIAGRLKSALSLREMFFDAPYYRLVHAEADGLPGLIVDRYDAAVVCQINAAGWEIAADILAAALDDVISPTAILLRGDARARALEGLEETGGGGRFLRGRIDGPIEIVESGVKFRVDILSGQKTGWYFDQRDNRAFIARIAGGKRLLDVYCHSGGFAIRAAAKGATETLGIDSSESALRLAVETAGLNDIGERCQWHRSDAFDALQELAQAKEKFDIVVTDPPAFAKARKDINSAKKGYRKLARLAATLVQPGGILFAASCSHHIEASAFTEEVARGVTAAGRTARLLRTAGAGPDHPIHPHLPESAYLKSVTLRLD